MAGGCEWPAAVDPEDREAENVGRGGQEASLSQAAYEADEIKALQKQQAGLRRRRRQLLKDVKMYRRKSSAAWSELGLADYERAPHAKMYLALADKREMEANNCAQMIKAYDDRVAFLEDRREALRRQAERFERMKLQGPR